MLVQTVKTQHVSQYSWKAWRAGTGIPDLSPGAVDGYLLLSIREAAEQAVVDILTSKQPKKGNRRSKAEEEVCDAYTCLDDLYQQAFSVLDQDAMKLLKKAFDTVMKKYYTVIFMDPQGNEPDFLAYASPDMYKELEAIVRQRNILDTAPDGATLQERIDKLKTNACWRAEDRFLCGQPVSGRTACSFWDEPEPGNKYQCYYQERNPGQKGDEDCFLCQCEAAWEEVGH